MTWDEPRVIILTATSHNEARKEARRVMRGVFVRILSTRRYCANGFILTYESRNR